MGHSSLSGRSRSSGRGGWLFFGGLLLGGGVGFWAGWYYCKEPPLGTSQQIQPTLPEPKSPSPPVESSAPLAPLTPRAAEPANGSPAIAPAPVADEPRLLRMEVTGSLEGSLSRQLEKRDAEVLSAHLGRLLIWWLDLRRDLVDGDRLEVLYRPNPNPEQLRVLALRYHSQKINRQLEAFYYQPPGARYGRYFDGQGQEIELRLRATPIEEYEQVTERMNLSGRRHRGVDFKADVGTPVLAPHRARVLRRNWQSRLNGNCLHLEYLDNGWYALLLHLDSIEPGIKPGLVVEAGQAIARSGNTGRSTAPHLHYELHSAAGRLLDPFLVEPTERRRLEGENLAGFEKVCQELRQRLTGGSPTDAATPPPVGSSGEKEPPK